MPRRNSIAAKAFRVSAVVRAALCAMACLGVGVASAQAGPSADLAREILESGGGPDGEAALVRAVAADPKDQEAKFGLGMVRFERAVAAFAQHQYRYGLAPGGLPMVPYLRVPVPRNPKPDLLTYDLQRAALARFLADLGGVETALADMGSDEVKVVLDLERVKIDATGEGRPDMTLMALSRFASGTPRPAGEPQPFEVAFDRGDAAWLRGYASLLSAGLEVLLAYDWHEIFDTAGGLFYPRLRTIGKDIAVPSRSGLGPGLELGALADGVALVHAIHWPLVEPGRLASARLDLKRMIAMSRESWAFIAAETDDDREWIPSPRQTHGVLPRMTVTQERVDAWLSALGDLDALLDGRALLAHWRFSKGIDLKRVFDEPRPFDLVLWLQGSAALPYLADGPTLDQGRLRVLQQAFNGDLTLFALYFN